MVCRPQIYEVILLAYGTVVIWQADRAVRGSESLWFLFLSVHLLCRIRVTPVLEISHLVRVQNGKAGPGSSEWEI